MWSSPRCPLRSHYLVHSKNNSFIVGIGPICDVELTCIFRPVFPFVCCIEDRFQYYNINFQYTSIIKCCYHDIEFFCALFWCIIWKNVHFEVLYLFPLHKHTATSNITIRQHSRRVTSTEKKFNNGDLSRLFCLKPIKLQ